MVSDLEVLWYCGLPGGLPGDLIEIDMDAVRAEGRIRLSNADYLPRPMRFTLDEVTSLVVALQAVRELAGDSATGSIDSLLTKLRKLTGEAEPRIAVSMAGGQADIRGVLADAIARRLAVLAHSLNLATPDEVVTTAELLDRFDPAALPRQPWVVAAQPWLAANRMSTT